MKSDMLTSPMPPAHAARGRFVKLAAVLAAVALTASACNSEPSAKRVAKDIINTIEMPDAQRDCLLDKIDGYTDDQLKAIEISGSEVSQNVGEDSEIDKFEADLASCA